MLALALMTFSKRRASLEEAKAQAIREVVAWKRAEAMKEKTISKQQNGHAAQDEPHPGGPDS